MFGQGAVQTEVFRVGVAKPCAAPGRAARLTHMIDPQHLHPTDIAYDGEGTFTLRFTQPGAEWEERLVVYLDDAESGHGNPGWAWSGAGHDGLRPDGQSLSVAEAVELVGPEHAHRVLGITRDYLIDLQDELRDLGADADVSLQASAAFLAQELAEAGQEYEAPEPDSGYDAGF